MLQRRLTRRQFLRRTAQIILGTTASALAGAAYASNIEPTWLDLHPVTLILPRLSPQFHGYRIAQISDIHIGGWMTRRRLEDVVALVNQEKVDLIAVTGDFASVINDAIASELVDVLRTLRARDRVVGVLGNHDYWSNAGMVGEAMRQSGIINVSNTVYTLERDPGVLHVAGVDDVWERHNDLDLVMAKLPKEGAAVLLAHEPDFADESAATDRFDLQISGHSHGGQVIVPFFGPPQLPYLGRKYPLGRYQIGGMKLYTNRGVGMIRPYLRLNCRPEITIFTLEAAQG